MSCLSNSFDLATLPVAGIDAKLDIPLNSYIRKSADVAAPLHGPEARQTWRRRHA